ncbi:hemerythrin domain-containing protein [Streptomyces cavernae]|uniref:hemerythrin domain-containing protein n=1 Tax=Streptomyces cavernae TaxID=2259034 RepID=UPI000FEB63D9|nr:hemerythrin domain-containing protein [Streptomyces cavernae]
MGHGGDVIQELTTDHREVEEFFAQIGKEPPGAPERKRVLDQLTIELVRHAIAEEEYLYPAVREHVENGDAIADKEIDDHSRVERLLKDLEGMEASDPEFNRAVVELETEVSEHVRDEETSLFVRLRQSCPQSALDELGDKIRTAKKLAPTRPHPSAPDTPPANKLLGPGVGLVDRVRDFVTGRGK